MLIHFISRHLGHIQGLRVSMSNRFLIPLAFVIGLGGGWFGKTWLESNQLPFGIGTGTFRITTATGDKPDTDTLATQSEFAQSGQTVLQAP